MEQLLTLENKMVCGKGKIIITDTAAQLGTVYTDIILETRTVDLTRLQQNHEGTRKCVSELGRRAKSSLS